MDLLSVTDSNSSIRGARLAMLPYGLELQDASNRGMELLLALVPGTLAETWANVNTWVQCLLIGLLVLCYTYLMSSVRFGKAIRSNKKDAPREAPVVPYWIPGLFHGLSLMDPSRFFLKLQTMFGSDTALQLRAGPFRVFFFRNPDDVQAAFRASKRTTNKGVKIFVLQRIFNLPKRAAQFLTKDDSGISLRPREESTVAPENRIFHFISSNIKRYLSSDFLGDLDQRYKAILLSHLDTLEVGSDWVGLPDLHAFIQEAAVRPTTEALVGSEFFKLNPSFVRDLWTFQQYTPGLFHLLPRWLMPNGYRVRQRLLDSVKRWHEHAHEHYDCSKLESTDPNWEPYFGFKLMRARQNYSHKREEMNADARATEDLSLIFVANTNIVTSTFWFIFEVLKRPELLAQLKEEIAECKTNDGTNFEIKKLTNQPLLQSTYAEVLRLYIAVGCVRAAEYGDINVAGYLIPKDSYLMMYSRSSALDAQVWTQVGRTLNKPLQEFDAERFLVEPDWVRPSFAAVQNKATDQNSSSKKRFSLDGLLGVWFPYGGGERICPGRHYAKHQMMLNLALILEKFDFDLQLSKSSKVPPNMSYAPYGALPPVGQIPFRIRRKAAP